MTPAGPVRGLTLRLPEVSLDALNVECIQKRPVMKQSSPAAALRAPRDLPIVKCEISKAARSQAGHPQRFGNFVQDDPMTLSSVAQFRPIVERQHKRVIETAARHENGPATREASDDGNVIRETRRFVDLPADGAEVPHDDRWLPTLPKSQSLGCGPRSVFFQGTEERGIQRNGIARIG